jgi:hypothetical protein
MGEIPKDVFEVGTFNPANLSAYEKEVKGGFFARKAQDRRHRLAIRAVDLEEALISSNLEGAPPIFAFRVEAITRELSRNGQRALIARAEARARGEDPIPQPQQRGRLRRLLGR